MIHAQENDFERVKEIFYQHKQWFPHIRTDYMRREIAKGHLVLDREVVITYNFYKRKQRIGDVLAQQGDCILHQRRVYLSVRSDNEIAKKFYVKNNMKLVGSTTWAKGTLPGDVYLHDII